MTRLAKSLLLAVLLAMCAGTAAACTSAIVSGRLTANGRPLLWKNRDTNDMNNRVERIVPTEDGTLEFVALFDARDSRDTAAWLGFNVKGFAIMNTASYNLNSPADAESGIVADREGVVMRMALEQCVTVDDFERLLKELPKPLGVEANFGVIDAQGNGAYFETGNYSYKKFDLRDEPSGILTRTNYSYSGRPDEGYGFNREATAKKLLKPYIANRAVTPAVFTEELSRSFYHDLLDKDFTTSGDEWVVDQDFIPRRISTASVVIEGVLPGENPQLTTMWIALGYPPCAEVWPVWTGENGVPTELTGTTPERHSTQCDKVLERKKEVFPITKGNGKHYVNLSKLYNAEGTGFCQILRKHNEQVYRDGYKALEQYRRKFKKH